ncbi:MAG: PQQ-binding-like beta-propeller repeat protein [Planctomycetes bacterium]|nr:PQQ-binding-like beta-propeller repeat protein [Planctomycetota bacterium]
MFDNHFGYAVCRTGGLFLVAVMALLRGTAFGAQPDATPGWPQWRGPTFDSISLETELLDQWPAEGPAVVWTRELGQGYSSFIAVGPHVFTLMQTLYEQAVVCLDAQTGKTVWSTRYGWPYDGGGLYPGPRSTPTWHAGRIYFAAPDGTIGCLNATNGTSIWSTNPTKEFRGRGTDFGYSCSPVVIDDKVILPVGGLGASVVALNAQDGSVVWKGGDSSASYASPLPITLNGQPQVIALLENSVAAFDLKSGTLLWEDEFSEGYDEHSAAPLYREPLLMIAGPFRGGAKCVRLDPNTDGGKPARVWETPKFSNDVASSVLYEGRIYGFDLRDAQSRVNRPSRGEYRCLDFETGKILWSTDKVGQASAIVADGKLILFNDSGELILARAGTDQYEELARTQVFRDEICWSPAALDQGRLYLRTQTQAACVYIGRPPLKATRPVQTVAEIPRGRSFDPTPLLGGEREFPATTPEWTEFGVWYLWSVAGILLASALAASTAMVLQCFRRPTVKAWASNPSFLEKTVFWLTIVVVGAIGSPLLNRWQSEYVFLWPMVLWAALQLTLLSTVWAERQPNRNGARWISRLAGVTFFAVSGLYFHLCRRLGLSIEWGYLSGLLPAFPFVALAAWEHLRPSRFRRWLDPLCAIGSFTAYFSSVAVFIKWWLRVGS